MTDHELQNNARIFCSSLSPKFQENIKIIVGRDSKKLDEAYNRLTVLQAWRSFILEDSLNSGSMGFYSEAQNDGLTTLALVSSGLWRPSLKSLRSLLENILHCFYYKDHSVEYKVWEAGKSKITFKSLFDYYESHPDIEKLPDWLQPAPRLRQHYRSLSEIVHASAKAVRMTDDLNQTLIWKTAASDIGRWSTLHKNVLRDTNALILVLMADRLQGASHKGLREALSLVIPEDKDQLIKNELGVKIIR